MMLYPPMAELVDKVGSRYLLVNVVARRARSISAEAEAEGLILDNKPVSCAIDEIYEDKLKLLKMETGSQESASLDETVQEQVPEQSQVPTEFENA